MKKNLELPKVIGRVELSMSSKLQGRVNPYVIEDNDGEEDKPEWVKAHLERFKKLPKRQQENLIAVSEYLYNRD